MVEKDMTLARQLMARAAGKAPEQVAEGDILTCNVDLALSHEALLRAKEPFEQMGATKAWDPDKVVVALDHWVPAPDPEIKDMQRQVYRFVKELGIGHFYHPGKGIAHQLVMERGHVHPGSLIVGTDSHTTTAGAMGAFAVGIGPTEFAAVLATGELWLKVPSTVGIRVRGDLPRGVYTKDLALAALKEVTCRGAIYKAVEWQGPTVEDLALGDRQTLCNMAAEMGAKTGIVAADADFLAYLRQFIEERRLLDGLTPQHAQKPTPKEALESLHELNVGNLEPQISCPPSPDNVCDIEEVEGTPVDQVFLGSCTNGRLEDLRIAAELVKGHQIAENCRMVIHSASKLIADAIADEGYLKVFEDFGASVEPSGCGPCFGGHGALLKKGETGFSTANRNFPGRMGHPDSKVFLGSPATAAATAIEGKIADPRRYLD